MLEDVASRGLFLHRLQLCKKEAFVLHAFLWNVTGIVYIRKKQLISELLSCGPDGTDQLH